MVRTEIGRDVLVGWKKVGAYIASPILYLILKDRTAGAQTTLHTIFEKAENLQNGGYYNKCKLTPVNPFTNNPANRKALCKRSEEMLGVSFPAE